jgi:dihydrofolate synthase/folylpolyglutamate synthase
MIPKKYVSEFVDTYRDRFEPISPSFFELTVGMAFDFFRNRQAEIVVVETGLGGRLDSTNVITPLVSVITNVSYDHMQFLGDTLEKIAAEKAGIIKPGVPVVIGETQESTTLVFENKAAQCSSSILWADQRFRAEGFELTGKPPGKRIMSVTRDGVPYISRLISPLTGIYQKKNILTVLGACEVVNDLGFALSRPMIRKGINNVIRNTALAGRWHVVNTRPLTICDTGHNEGGMREILTQIASTPHEHLHFVFGVVNDKDLNPIFSLLPREATYYFCKPGIPRGLEAEILQSQAMAAGLTGKSYRSVKAALQAAAENAGVSDLVFVGGSTFVVAEVV